MDNRPTYFLLKRKTGGFTVIAEDKNCDILRTKKARLVKRGVTGLFLHARRHPSERDLVGVLI